MAQNSPIEWTDHTWSPWEGCTKVSPGCNNCYAEGMNRWLRKGENWGPGAPRREFSEKHWEKPLRWNEKAAKAGTRPRVFPSICDPFDNEVPDAWRHQFLRLILDTPQLTWLLLTKRIGNVAKMLDGDQWNHLGNVWLGATVVNQEEADRDIPKLLAVPARVRFLSVEPMLAPVDVRFSFADARVIRCPRCMFGTNILDHGPCPNDGETLRNDPGVDWVICGGESGPHSRPMHPDWARSLRDQCATAGVPFFFKQWGEWIEADRDGSLVYAGDSSGVMLGERRYVSTRVEYADFVRVGKAAAGRLLDGRTHDEFPE